VITGVVLKAARDKSLIIDFEAIPYSESVCFRPPFLGKPQIAGTVPARVTSNKDDPVYSRLDDLGRYRVSFLFDRDSWEKGRESMWLRLARPYAGATHGLHLPLIAGTEVAIAFEQGDPDRPYIAHALHDNKHQDHVTLDNQQRNVLRTPANNKLRMDDTRGKEHVKLSTDYGGKSQLNLGYMTGVKKNGVYQKRGDGFELRSDSHGVIRGGAGVFISANKQAKAQGEAIDMKEAIAQLEEAVSRVKLLAGNAHLANTEGADTTVPEQLKAALSQLKEAGFLVSAPGGMALVTPEHLQLSAGQTLSVVGNNADLSILKRFSITAGSAINMFAQRLGIKLIANKGPVSVQAQNDRLELLARSGLDITSTEDEIRITAKKKITLNSGTNYITIDPYRVEIGSPGEVEIKAPYFNHTPSAARLNTAIKPLAGPLADTPNQLKLHFLDGDSKPVADVPYKVRFNNGQILEGRLDEQGRAVHSPVPDHPAQVEYLFPAPERGPEWQPHSRIAAAMGESVPRSDLSGPGKWVTENIDYHGARNLGQLLLNRLISMGDEGRVYGSEGKDYEHTKRTVTQIWQRLGEGEERFEETSAAYRYGEQRRMPQTYLEGPDDWSTTGKSWYWQPGVASTVYENKEAGR
jgi:type VI secretion system secreted protein VgrG